MSVLPPAFLTYGWCRVSYVIINSLARKGVKVHVGDRSRLAMCRYSRHRSSFSRYRNPYTDPAGFVEDVSRAMSRTGATVLIPGHEDALAISRLKEQFPANVLIPVADSRAIEQAINKWRIIELAHAAGVPAPETFKPETREEVARLAKELEYPAVVKTQIGNSAKGVLIVQSPRECVERFDWLVNEYGLRPPNWPMLQAFAPGDGYGVCLLYNRGELRASFCERYIRCKDGNFGTSVFRESVDVPELVSYAQAVMKPLNWHGVAHLDFLYDPETRRAALIEINPRFWGALDLAVRAGVDFPWLLYKMAVDGDVEPVNFYRVGVKSRWILGELMHVANRAKRGGLVDAGRAFLSINRERCDGYDDFRLSDPAPLFFEALYYATRFLATGNSNPVEEGMIG